MFNSAVALQNTLFKDRFDGRLFAEAKKTLFKFRNNDCTAALRCGTHSAKVGEKSFTNGFAARLV